MKAKVKNTVVIIAVIAISYVAGAIIGLPSTSGNLGRGDISKVSKFHKESVATQYSAYEQKLLADSQAMADENLSTGVLAQKLIEFSDLVDLSVEVAGNIEELNENVIDLRNLQDLSANVANTAYEAVNALANLESGNVDKTAQSYEQASHNLMVAYLMVDNQAATGKEFAIAADEYYVKHRELTRLAEVRDLWATFCCECALLRGTEDSEEKYWAANTDAKIGKITTIKVLSKSEAFMKSADVVMKNGEAVMKSSDVVMKNGEAVMKSSDVVMKNGEAVMKNGEAIMKSADVVMKNGEAVMKSSDVVMKNGEAVMKSSDVVMKNGEAVMKNGEAIIWKSSDVVMKNGEALMLIPAAEISKHIVSKSETTLSKTSEMVKRNETLNVIFVLAKNETSLGRNEQSVKKTVESIGKSNNDQKKY